MPNISQLSPIGKLTFADTASYPLPGTIVPCLMCAKPFLMRAYTGVPDQICEECWRTYEDAARVVCKNCKVTICRAQPKVLDNGFYVQPRMILTSDCCNVCNPGLTESTILEIDTWERTRRPGRLILPGKVILPSGRDLTES